jgi:hypothetical protein
MSTLNTGEADFSETLKIVYKNSKRKNSNNNTKHERLRQRREIYSFL